MIAASDGAGDWPDGPQYNGILDRLRGCGVAHLSRRRTPDESREWLNRHGHGKRVPLKTVVTLGANQIEAWWPIVSPHLRVDSYVTIHGFAPYHRREDDHWIQVRWTPREFTRAAERLGVEAPPYARRLAERCNFITSLAVDIDCETRGLDPCDVIGDMHRLVLQNQLPPFSRYVLSGRGVWLEWTLHDHLNPSRPVRADWNARRWHRQLQEWLVSKLTRWGADPAAVDLARIYRIPGSRNSKATGDGTVQVFESSNVTYSLAEFAHAARVKLLDHDAEPDADVIRQLFPPDVDRPHDATVVQTLWLPARSRDSGHEKSERHQRARLARWAYWRRRIEALIEIRDQCETGFRGWTMTAIAVVLRKCNTPKHEAKEFCRSLVDTWLSQDGHEYTKEEAADAVARVYATRGFFEGFKEASDRKLAGMLRLTTDEAAAIAERTGRKCRDGLGGIHHPPALPQPAKPASESEQRRELIAKWRAADPAVPPSIMSRWLPAHGFQASLKVVWKDLQLLNN